MRTALWQLEGFKFLNQINPQRYNLRRESFLEGMFVEYYLIDEESKTQIDSRIVRNSMTGECWLK